MKKPILSKIDLELFPGEFVAIVGPSGEGKSSLLNILGMLQSSDSGSYFFKNNDISKLNESELNSERGRSIGFIFQSANLFDDLTAIENMGFGLRQNDWLPDEIRQRTLNLASWLDLTESMNQSSRHLSGGERQRVAVARAVAGGPSLLLADEPTGNLDSDNARRVVELLATYAATGAAVVVVTHDLSVANAADRVLRLADGELHELSSNVSPSILDGVDSTFEYLSPSAKMFAEPPSSEQRRRPLGRLANDAADAVLGLIGSTFRSALLVLGFAVAAGALCLSAGISTIAAQAVDSSIQNAGSEVVSVSLPSHSTSESSLPAEIDEWVTKAKALDHVISAGYVAFTSANAVPVSRFSSDGLAIGPSLSPSVASVSPELLAPNQVQDKKVSDASVLVSSDLAEPLRLGRSELASAKPGYQLRLGGQRLGVVGYFDAVEGAPELSKSIVVSRNVLSKFELSESRLILKVNKGHAESVANILPVALDAYDPGQFSVQTVAELQSLRASVGDDLKSFVSLISVLVFALGLMGAAVAMFTSVNSRRSEISLRRALGASKFRVGALFVFEGAIAGFIGGCLGITLSTLILYMLYDGVVHLDWSLLFIGSVGGIACGVFSAFLPAWLGSRRPPAVGLRE